MTNLQSTMQHLAIILDGNRRWAVEQGIPKIMGHTEGAKNIKRIAKAAQKAGIQYLTLYVLSTENLKNRSESELKHLFTLFGKIVDYLGEFIKNNARLNIIGDISKLPENVQKNLQDTMEKTKDHTGITITLAANYGGRDEIIRAVKNMLQSGVQAHQVTEERISNSLDTAGMPDVDLLIRTGGDQRLSNMLPWQTVYAELYFTPVKWPAFSPEDLQDALEWFAEQKRNKGK